MNTKLNFASPSSTLTFVAAALATVIALGILSTVVILFQEQGRTDGSSSRPPSVLACSTPTNRSVRPA